MIIFVCIAEFMKTLLLMEATLKAENEVYIYYYYYSNIIL